MRQHSQIGVRLVRRPVSRQAFEVMLILILVGIVALSPEPAARAQATWNWYKADLHAHSVISADAINDLGILSQSAKANGYNAIFLTDHNFASSFAISGLTANHIAFEDTYRRWARGTYGSPASTTNALVSLPINTGKSALHLKTSSTGYGETFIWSRRGPNFRSGNITMQVSIFPTRIDPGSGVYVSAAIGGDPTVEPADGYTTQNGVIAPGKTTVLVWQLGNPRVSSSDPNARVLTYSLGSYTLNTWNSYTIDISSALADIPPADRPVDYAGLTYLKLAAGATSGTAEAFFDTFSIDASTPVPPAEEFIYRNSLIHSYDTGSFKLFPSIEMGINKHAQRFNFGITAPSEFVSYTLGINGISPTQQSGYPAMLNHPGSDGGVTEQEALSTQAAGAEFIEVRYQPWIDIWDGILKQGVQLLGAGSTDTHKAFSRASDATYIYAPSLDFDALIQSLFEGRTYVANGSFDGPIVFTNDAGSQEPYPARYPIYVPDTQQAVDLHLAIGTGLSNGDSIRWIRDGTLIATDQASGKSYTATRSVVLAGTSTYVRAEVRDRMGALKALTQPIFFVSMPALPDGMSYHIARVITADGHGFTKIRIKGIADSTWDGTAQRLSLTLQNPAGALAELLVSTNRGPLRVKIAGAPIPAAFSAAAFDDSTGSTWYYDGLAHLLHLKVRHQDDIVTPEVEFSIAGDIYAPSTPAGLTATSLGTAKIDLAWLASTDDTDVAGYTIRRDDLVLATVAAGTLFFHDTGLMPSTTYTYTVEAFDTAGNYSAPSAPAIASTSPARRFLPIVAR